MIKTPDPFSGPANVGAWHLNLWAYTLVELWAWDRPEDELVDRTASPWDAEWRRPSHADRRKALLRETLRADIQAAACGAGPGGPIESPGRTAYCCWPPDREKLAESAVPGERGSKHNQSK